MLVDESLHQTCYLLSLKYCDLLPSAAVLKQQAASAVAVLTHYMVRGSLRSSQLHVLPLWQLPRLRHGPFHLSPVHTQLAVSLVLPHRVPCCATLYVSMFLISTFQEEYIGKT